MSAFLWTDTDIARRTFPSANGLARRARILSMIPIRRGHLSGSGVSPYAALSFRLRLSLCAVGAQSAWPGGSVRKRYAEPIVASGERCKLTAEAPWRCRVGQRVSFVCPFAVIP